MKRVKVEAIPEARACLGPEVSHHLAHVLRSKVGRPLVVFDGRGTECTVEIVRIEAGSVWVQRTSEVREIPRLPQRELVLAVLKHQAMDLAVRMATECAVSTIHPVITERTIAKGNRTDRWERIARAAASQCGRADVPEIRPVSTLREALDRIDLPLYAALLDAGPGVRAAGPFAVCIGPAGGFSPRETALLEERATAVSLGPHVLRAETAAAVALSVLATSRRDPEGR